MQIMVITQLIKNEFTIFCICLLSDQGCNRKLARPAYGLTIFRYRTRAIITRGLYFFYPLFYLKWGLYYRQLMD